MVQRSSRLDWLLVIIAPCMDIPPIFCLALHFCYVCKHCYCSCCCSHDFQTFQQHSASKWFYLFIVLVCMCFLQLFIRIIKAQLLTLPPLSPTHENSSNLPHNVVHRMRINLQCRNNIFHKSMCANWAVKQMRMGMKTTYEGDEERKDESWLIPVRVQCIQLIFSDRYKTSAHYSFVILLHKLLGRLACLLQNIRFQFQKLIDFHLMMVQLMINSWILLHWWRMGLCMCISPMLFAASQKCFQRF